MPLPPSRFDPIHTGRAEPSRYLIIGFDTEYQRYADEDTRTLNNEVLSYQYCCTVIERDGDDASAPIWSGLLKPKGPKVSDRLSLQEFLVAALSDGCIRFPDLKLPSTIYLVAHFTRADAPCCASSDTTIYTNKMLTFLDLTKILENYGGKLLRNSSNFRIKNYGSSH